MTKFIEKSYVVASLLNVKRKYLSSYFVSKSEVNLLVNYFQKKFNELDIDALFISNIDKIYFNVICDDITLSGVYDFESVEMRYQAFLPIDILLIIWNEELVLSKLLSTYEDDVKKLKKTINEGV